MSELDLRGNNYLADGIHSKVLNTLKLGSRSTQELMLNIQHRLVELLSPSDFVTDCLAVMAVEGHIELRKGEWNIMPNGIAMANFLSFKASKKMKLSVADHYGYRPSASEYQGHELQTTSPRRGAYDFLALPSRYGSEYVPHPTAHLAESHKEQFSN